MVRRRALLGLTVAATGLVMALAPLSTATASIHHTTMLTSSKKGIGPLCRDLKNEQSGSSQVGSSISAAISSGNLANAKKQIINAINHGLKTSAPVLTQLGVAPGNVRTAVKGLIKLDQTLIASIKKTTSLANLETPFATLAKNPHLTAYVATVTNYIRARCGSVLTTTTTTKP